MRMQNPTTPESDVVNKAEENDVNGIPEEHQAKNSDTPGQAAMKARMRQTLSKLKTPADETFALPRNRAGASGSFEANVGGTMKKLAGMITPAAAEAEAPDPYSGVKKGMRKAQSSGDTTLIRRFSERLKSLSKK